MTDKNKRKGNYGHKLSEATKQKIRDARAKQKPPRLGIKLNDKQKKTLSLAHKGQVPWNTGIKYTDKQKENVIKNNKNLFKKGNTANKGRKYSDEEKEKRAITMRKVRLTQKYKDAQHKGMLGLQNALGHKQTEETIAKRMKTMKPIFDSLSYRAKLREKRLHQTFPQVDSKPELKLQLALDLAKIKYKKHVPLIGQPDIFVEPNLCIFVDGCYFHGCVACKGERVLTDSIPQKAIANDQIVNSSLRSKGFTVIRIWEHEINNDETAVIDLIREHHSTKTKEVYHGT